MAGAAGTRRADGMMRAEDMSFGRRAGVLAFLMLAYFFYAWAWNTVDILRPYIRDSVGMTTQQSGWLYSIQSIGALVGAVVMGQVADRIGRRNALMLVMLGYGACLIAGAFVQSFWQLAVERSVMGFFMGAMYPIVVGIYGGLFPSEQRGMVAGFIMGTYNVAVALLAGIAGLAISAGYDWRTLLYLGVVPMVAALFARRIVPDDKRVAAWGTDPDAPTVARTSLPIAELFAPGVRRQTVLLACVTGLNFFAYQAFTGWASTYLKDVRGIDADLVGAVLFWQFLASAIGGFAWGWISDRIGRTRAALGFVLAAAIIPVWLFAPLSDFWFMVVGFAYGFMLSASTVWGPWLSELYPPHLRSTAASIFNWGRVISIFAPIITGALVPVFGMAPVMMLGCAAFVVAAAIWFSLPETLRREKPAA